MKILIDHVHAFGSDIRISPDKSLNEVRWTRDIAKSVVSSLRRNSIDTSLVVPEDKCASIESRITRLRRYARNHGPSNILLVVITLGARSGQGRWSADHGWSIVRNDSCQASAALMDSLTESAIEELGPMAMSRPSSSFDYHLLNNVQLLSEIGCPAVITTNLHLDNREDIKKLSSTKGRQSIVDLHVKGILRYLEATL